MPKTAIASLLIVLIAAIWWFAFDSRAPQTADDAIPLEALRQVIGADRAPDLPLEVELYRTGSGSAPMFAVQAGGGFGKFAMVYTAFGIRYPAGRVMIDAAADRETAMTIGDKDAAQFDEAAYALLLERIQQADAIILTHEHKDHVMAVVRNTAFDTFADRLRFPESQRYGLARHAESTATKIKIGSLSSIPIDRATRIAPGIAVARAPGHSPGSLVILVRLATGNEYLFIGDIAWSFDDITSLKTRPRFLQWMMFDPKEQRNRVLRQLRALHDIHRREPDLVIVPSHDRLWFDHLVAKGRMKLAQADEQKSADEPDRQNGGEKLQ